MKQNLINDFVQGMLPYLNNAQNEKLQEVLQYVFADYEVKENQQQGKTSKQNFVELFSSLQLNGKSPSSRSKESF